MAVRFSLLVIAEQHFASFRGASVMTRVIDALVFLVLPIVLGVMCVLGGASLAHASNSLIVGISIISALMCASAVALFQLRVQLRESGDRFVNDRDKRLIDETFFNILWVIIVGMIMVTLLVIADLSEWFAGLSVLVPAAMSGAVAALGVHYLFTVFMSLKRLAKAYLVIGAHRR